MLLPLNRIADFDLAIAKHFGIGAAASIRIQRRLQAGNDFIHTLAGFGFAGNFQSRGADSDNPSPRVGERKAAHQ